MERERQEIAEHPEEEKEELSLFYQLKGIDPQTADELAERLAQDPEAMLQALSVEEFGASEHPGNPAQASLAAGLSHRTRRDHPCDPVHLHDRHRCDRRRAVSL